MGYTDGLYIPKLAVVSWNPLALVVQDLSTNDHHPDQMTTVLDDNVHNFGVDGSSDDLDVPIKVRIIIIIKEVMMIWIIWMCRSK